ncbi:serine/threonine-protein kinase [Candidatus Hydrogenedentota bacterium]
MAGTYLCDECRKKKPDRTMAPTGQSHAPPESDTGKLRVDQRKAAEKGAAHVIEDILEAFHHHRKRESPPPLRGYRGLEKTSDSALGAVYKATRTRDGVTVAVKTLLQTHRPVKQHAAIFEREKFVAASVQHDHIVHPERISKWGDIHFIEMEYMSGGSLWDRLRENESGLSLVEALPIMLQSLEGLAHAHDTHVTINLPAGPETIRSIVHRDIKPSNILLTRKGGSLKAKVSDFSLSKAFAEAGMARGAVTADPGAHCPGTSYMAPEHLVNYRYVEPATDVFEIAAVFYHMFTGNPVWDTGNNIDPLKAILEAEIAPIRSRDHRVPAGIAHVIDRALSRNKEDRYPDAGAMLEALRWAV